MGKHDALSYVKDYFYDNHYSFNIQLCDIFLMKYNRKFDITMSSGFIEHFIGEQQKSLCDIHKKYSKKYIICVVPFADKKCIEFFKSAECKRRYGFQKPLNAMELRKCFEDDKWKEIHSEVYYERNPLLIGIYRRR